MKHDLSGGGGTVILFVENMRIVEALAGYAGVAELARSFSIFAIPNSVLFHPDHTINDYVGAATGGEV